MQGSDRTFEISACLGRGGFGEVYRARMTRDGGLVADVALKVLRRDIDADGQAVQRLRDEGRLLSQLNHPSILKVHDLVVLAGRVSLVTEYVDGDDLTACLKEPAPIGPRALFQVIARVASALDAAWTARPPGVDAPLRMVHRDIKPSNIRLSRHGDVKLLDFGIARTDAVQREARTRTDMMVGSPAYMAPERFLERQILLESDVFSLGAVLYEGLGDDRFYGDLPVPMQVGLAVDDERYATFLESRLALLDVPDDVRTLLASALAYDAADRPTPVALARECDALADALGGPSLARYCRARAWSTMASVAGELDGHTLREGEEERPAPRALALVDRSAPTLETPAPVPFPQPDREPRDRVRGPAEPRRRGSFWGWALVGVGGTGVVALVAVLALSVLGVLTLPWAFGPAAVESDVATAAAPVPDPAPAPVPEPPPPEPEPEPEPEAAPAPVPTSRPSPRPAPAPVEAPPPDPRPAPTPVVPDPVPTGPAPGHIRMEGEVVALAVGSGGSHVLPADLAPGVYRLQAKYNGRDAVDAGELVVRSGQTITVSCSSRMTRCTQK
ncbi:MAG: serine/threonine-protein kinase [Myxococcota bacterium]